ncbi:MAG: PD-(D/E)XK motif protein [Alphaproteobacteria bacterium]|nr:PD-(D/E)XK motif protein [Alphaproteobacteria bacterium]MBU1512491.1 PD-(D/E)XK motif protein [Alphaproteobacteria bacterium]MBU2096585.1 PD-(D/E)XK motif protein [Alphaproteobacteria bacterium]MBU2151597.1 PD-(D/E)XK motif protein [Alphaproteobacteria bacterium]MBU2307315.1 PD-(D/E)XK motif protein [Alphaproteobacteria bacterium]
MSGLEGAWALLGAEARPESGWHSRRIFNGSACTIRAGIRQPSGTRGILFEVAASAVAPGAIYPDCAGFTLRPEPLVAGPGGTVRLALEERHPAWRDIFGILGNAVARQVAARSDEPAAVSQLFARLAAWQRFLAAHGPGRMSEKAQAGLVAELLFLERHVLPGRGGAASVAAWRGPTGAPQDFCFPRCLVEVKGTKSFSPASFRVSNLEQLSGETGLPLFVCHMGLTLAATDGRTLPEIVDQLRVAIGSTLDGGDALFEEMIFEAGYLDAHAAAYAAPAYAIGPTRWFRVDEGFPRLVPGSVPQGVQSAVYSVSLAACAPFEVDAEACLSLTGPEHG